MNHFGASEGESPRPWWRSRARHAALQRDEAPIREHVYQNVPIPAEFQSVGDTPEVIAWRRGVNDTLERGRPIRPDWLYGPEGLKLPGRSVELDAFAAVYRDNPNLARSLVRGLSQKDKAILTFYLRELERITEEEETFVRTDERRAAREDRDTVDLSAVDLSAIVEGHRRDI